MKSTITPAPKTPAVNPYPCLKQCKHGYVVMFIGPATGIVVHSAKGGYPIGKFCGGFDSNKAWPTQWVESEFAPFNGSITLSNN